MEMIEEVKQQHMEIHKKATQEIVVVCLIEIK